MVLHVSGHVSSHVSDDVPLHMAFLCAPFVCPIHVVPQVPRRVSLQVAFYIMYFTSCAAQFLVLSCVPMFPGCFLGHVSHILGSDGPWLNP